MTVEERARRAGRDIRRAMQTLETSSTTADHSLVERFVRFRTRKDRNRAVSTIAVVAVIAVGFVLSATSIRDGVGEGRAAPGASAVPTRIGTLTITDAGCTLDGLMELDAGAVTLEALNKTNGPKTVVVFRIANEERFARMLAFVERVRPHFGNPAHGPGHASEDARLVQSRFFEYASTSETDLDAHASLVVSGAFDPGTYGVECVGRGRDRGDPSDFVGPIHVRSP